MKCLNELTHNKIFLYAFGALYLVIALCFGYFIRIGLTYDKLVAVEFSFVATNLLLSLILYEKSKDFAFTFLALAATLGADRILIYNIKELLTLGMVIFLVAQIAYFCKCYYQTKNCKLKNAFVISVIISTAAAEISAVIFVGSNMNALSVVALAYYSFLINNCIFAFTRFLANPLFAIGLLLFVACDTVLGLQMLNNFGISTNIAQGLDCWWFYHPSQALIFLSLIYCRLFKVSRGRALS